MLSFVNTVAESFEQSTGGLIPGSGDMETERYSLLLQDSKKRKEKTE